jgi:carboxylesterase
LDYYDQEAAKNHLGYRVLPTYAVAEVADLVSAMRRALPEVHAPSLIIHSTHDGGVHPRNARAIFSHLGAQHKQLLWVEHSGHVILLEPERERAAKAILDFVAFSQQERQ